MHEPTPRASRLRTTAFASAVALVLGLPLAFVTVGGPADGAARDPHSAAEPLPAPGPRLPGSGPGTMAGAGAFCGDEVGSPEGLRAKACVLTEGAETWSRVYWTNTSGPTGSDPGSDPAGSAGALTARLTMHRPDGGRVEVECALPSDGERGTCETPREPTAAERPGQQPYLAVAEISATGAGEEDGPVLRAESEPTAKNPVAGDGGYTSDRAHLRR
ncbi:hypothetical protein [Streptomyces aidingensis]|uniref:Uncharacterized protein n=1 Tax=Streptomyces aidingensis TaxID=910347 RepID=A0A1I1QC79_9ACTN|nr:hypothetical protein [Streptomyces aidingensis]SFD19645.1 hypothetical protein SAMN05421773_11116 [Streptomyces aidingensis]